jgi:putative tricarboxylic transport membrane protein
MLTDLMTGFTLIFNPECILMIFFGTFLGIIIGALPGLTATMGVAIFSPLTFTMEPIPGIAFLLGVYCGGIYGGSITAILIKTPGTSSAAATVFDGYPLAQKGKGLKALQMALYASVIGGLFSSAVLIFVAPLLARIALHFGPPEYFALGVFGLSIVATVSGRNVIKGLISGAIGLLISFVGLDPVTGAPRLTFGSVTLQGGFQLIPCLVGLFALSELMIQAEDVIKRKMEGMEISGESLTLKELLFSKETIFKGCLIGTFIGAVPATGGGVAAFTSYNEALRSSKDRHNFGKGSLDGVAATESANNAGTGGALIPLLTLGIPGDSVTAVLLGALMVQGLTPGPLLFQEAGDIMYALFAGLIICNIAMLIQGYFGVKIFYNITKIPGEYLYPSIFALCIIGAYAVNSQIFDVISAIGFGLLGYLMIKLDFPTVPILLALILGPLTESNLRRGLLATNGELAPFFLRPATLIILAMTVASITFFAWKEMKGKKIQEEALQPSVEK